jgi:hypothetical protein
MRFSPSTGNFYPENVTYPAGTLPADLVEVAQADHDAALNAPAGSTFTFNTAGVLAITPPAPAAAPTAAQLQAALVAAAVARLVSVDRVAIRCVKKSVPFTAPWLAYDAALVAIVNGTDTTSTLLPRPPLNPDGSVAYPPGS